MTPTGRPALVGALAAAVIALIASGAMALGSLGGSSTRPAQGLNLGQWGGMMGGQGQGMMGGQGQGMMGGQGQGTMGGQGQGMMGSFGSTGMSWLPGDGVAVSSIPAARARAAKAAAPAGLHPGEVMWFDNGFYVELKDSAQKPATEVIVDPRTGAVSTEPGPAMMWNTRFGMGGAGSSTGSVTETKAREIATSWLAANQRGTTIEGIDAYPGYFTLDLQRDGTVSGMMSVSSSTGALWYHSWHGTFKAMED